MVYQRSREIESRLSDLLTLIQTGRYSTPKLAATLGISKPTVSRCVSALRERGYLIESVKGPEGWAYILAEGSTAASPPGGQSL
ncbi:MAG: HTH domain-containing protein [Acidimicrobiales bacterium]